VVKTRILCSAEALATLIGANIAVALGEGFLTFV